MEELSNFNEKHVICWNLSLLAYVVPNLHVIFKFFNFIVSCTIVGHFVMGWSGLELQVGIAICSN